MHIAYVCADPGVPAFGTKGCSIHVQEVLRALVQIGAEVDLFAMDAGGACPPDLATIGVHAIPFAPSRDAIDRERELLAANVTVRQMLLDRAPYDLVYERHALWASAAMEFGRDERIAGVTEVNAPLIDEQSAHRRLCDRVTAELISTRALWAAGTVVAVSESVAQYARRLGVEEARIHVVPNGVRPDRFSLRSGAARGSSGQFTIGFVGSLRPWHGATDLVTAFGRLARGRALSAPRLLIVGHGPQREMLEAQVAALPFEAGDSVQFTGSVPYEAIPGLLDLMNVAVAPYAETQSCYFSPLKLFEYMAAGLPIIAARTGQLDEIIQHERNGLLYPPGDIGALCIAIERLRGDPELASRLGVQARRDALRHHTWWQRVEEILSRASVAPANPRLINNHEGMKITKKRMPVANCNGE